MVKDKELAKHLLYIAQYCVGTLDNSLLLSRLHYTEEEFLKHRKAVGRVMGELLTEIMDPIYWEYPDLDPLRTSTDVGPSPPEAAAPPEERGEPAPDDRNA